MTDLTALGALVAEAPPPVGLPDLAIDFGALLEGEAPPMLPVSDRIVPAIRQDLAAAPDAETTPQDDVSEDPLRWLGVEEDARPIDEDADAAPAEPAPTLAQPPAAPLPPTPPRDLRWQPAAAPIQPVIAGSDPVVPVSTPGPEAVQRVAPDVVRPTGVLPIVEPDRTTTIASAAPQDAQEQQPAGRSDQTILQPALPQKGAPAQGSVAAAPAAKPAPVPMPLPAEALATLKTGASLRAVAAAMPRAVAAPSSEAPRPVPLSDAAAPAPVVDADPAIRRAVPGTKLDAPILPQAVPTAAAQPAQAVPAPATPLPLPLAPAPVEAPVQDALVAPQVAVAAGYQPIAAEGPKVAAPLQAPAAAPATPVIDDVAPTSAPITAPVAAAVVQTASPPLATPQAAPPAVAPAPTKAPPVAADAPQPVGVVALPTTPAAAGPQPAAFVPELRPVDTGRADWVESFVERIDQAREAMGARTSTIRLAPDALGMVEVRIREDAGMLRVALTAETVAARTLLSDAAPRLAEQAEARGLRIAETSITAPARSADAGTSRDGQGRPTDTGPGSRGAEADTGRERRSDRPNRSVPDAPASAFVEDRDNDREFGATGARIA